MDNCALCCMISVCLYVSSVFSLTHFISAMFAWIKYDGWIETLHVLNQIWSAVTHLTKSDLVTPICAAGRPRCLFTCKRGRGLWHSVQIWHRREQDDYSHYDQKDLSTGLDRSHLKNLDQSRFVSRDCQILKRMQPLIKYHWRYSATA